MRKYTYLLLLLCSMIAQTAMADGGKTFRCAAMNVDGLPASLSVLGQEITLNPDSKGAAGATAIANKVVQNGWDFFGVSEDFNYNTQLMAPLNSAYKAGTYYGGINASLAGIGNAILQKPITESDGLNFIWKKSLTVTDETKVPYSTFNGYFNDDNDGFITKGYRSYTVDLGDGALVDVVITHMDAGSSQGDINAREVQIKEIVAGIKALIAANKRPVIVMGDFNCRYTRDKLKTLFVDALNTKPLSCIDCWIKTCKNGTYPTFGKADLVVGEPIAEGSEEVYDYETGEIVDKMFLINTTEGLTQLSLKNFKVDTDFVDANGEPLADHYPVVGEFEVSRQTLDLAEYDSEEMQNETTLKTDGTKYYIINKATGKFLNDDNGFDAAQSEDRTLWTISKSGNNYQLKSEGGKYVSVTSRNAGSLIRPNYVYSAATNANSASNLSAINLSGDGSYYTIGNNVQTGALSWAVRYLSCNPNNGIEAASNVNSENSQWIIVSAHQYYYFNYDLEALKAGLKAAYEKADFYVGYKPGKYSPVTSNGIYEAYVDGLKFYNECYNYTQEEIDAQAEKISPSKIAAWQPNPENMPAIDEQNLPTANVPSFTLPLDNETIFKLEFDHNADASVTVKDAAGKEVAKFDVEGDGHTVRYFYTGTSKTYTITFVSAGDLLQKVSLVPCEFNPVFTALQLEADQKYFLYNVVTDRFVTESGFDTETFPVCYTLNADRNLLGGTDYTLKAENGYFGGNANGVNPVANDAREITFTPSVAIDGAYELSYKIGVIGAKTYYATANPDDQTIHTTQESGSLYSQWFLVSELDFYENYPGAADLAKANFDAALARLKALFYRNEEAEGLISNLPTALANSTSNTIKDADKVVEAGYPYSPLYIFEQAVKMNALCDELPSISQFYLACKQDIANAEKMSSGATLRTATTLAKGELELCSTTTGMSVVMSAMRVAVVGYMQTIRDFADNQDFTGLLANPSFETGDMTGWLGIDVMSNISNLTGMISGNGQIQDIAGMLSMIGFGENSQPKVSQKATDGKYIFESSNNIVVGTLGQQAAQLIIGLPQGKYEFTADMESVSGGLLLGNSHVGVTTVSISLKELLGTAIDMVDTDLIKKVVEVISQVAAGSEEGVAPDYMGLIGEILTYIQEKGFSLSDQQFLKISNSEFKAQTSMAPVSCTFETDGTDIVLVMANARFAAADFFEKILGGILGAAGDGNAIMNLINELGDFGSVLTSVAPYRADNFHLTHLESHKPDYLAKLAVTSALAALGTQYGMVKSQTLDKEEDVDDRHKDYEYFQDEMAKTLVANDEETAIKQRIDALADEVENTPIYKFNEIVKEGILGDILKLSLELDKFYAEYVPANAAIKRFIANYNNVEDHYYEVREATIYNEDYDEDYYAYSTPKSGDAYQDVVAALAKVLGNPDDGSLLEDDYESIWERLEEIRIDYVRKTEPRVYAVNLPLYLSRLANIDACLRIFQNGFFATLDDYKAALDGVAESKTRYDEEVAADNEMTETNQAIFMSDLDEEGETLVTTYARDIEDIKNSLLKKDATPVIATETSNDAPAYNLNGVLLNKNAKGIIIRDGKKILVK